jgi:hypothetical protein
MQRLIVQAEDGQIVTVNQANVLLRGNKLKITSYFFVEVEGNFNFLICTKSCLVTGDNCGIFCNAQAIVHGKGNFIRARGITCENLDEQQQFSIYNGPAPLVIQPAPSETATLKRKYPVDGEYWDDGTDEYPLQKKKKRRLLDEPFGVYCRYLDIDKVQCEAFGVYEYRYGMYCEEHRCPVCQKRKMRNHEKKCTRCSNDMVQSKNRRKEATPPMASYFILQHRQEEDGLVFYKFVSKADHNVYVWESAHECQDDLKKVDTIVAYWQKHPEIHDNVY